MDSFLIVSQLSIVKTEFMDNLENEKPGPGWPWLGRSGNLAPPSKGMLQPQKKCTRFMTLDFEMPNKRVCLLVLAFSRDFSHFQRYTIFFNGV